MFVTGQLAGVTPERDGNQVRVHGAASRTYGAVTGQVLNPTMPGYVADMAAPYGLAVRADLLEQGVGHAYGEMCLPLLAELVPAARPADLLVLATEIPDIRFGRTTATFLSSHCPGGPLAFTVCDQGPLSAFTALHLIVGYARTGDCRRAVLLVAEQPTVYHELPVATTIPDRAVAVGVVLETNGTRDALSVRRHTKLAEQQLSAVVGAEVAGLAAGGVAPTVLVGARLSEALTPHAVGGDLRVCGENQPFTGVWQAFSHLLAEEPHSGAPVLLADYDPAGRQLFTAHVRRGDGPPDAAGGSTSD